MTTIRSRELGDALRLAMEGAGYNGKRFAHDLGWSEAKLSRLLTGHNNVSELDISAFLALCKVKGAERDRLMSLARELTVPGWLQQHVPNVPEQLKTLVDHENKAASIVEFEPIRIPGLLQTANYARSLVERSATVPRDEVPSRVTARMGRQAIYAMFQHPIFTFLIHEGALRLPVGGSEVMSEQLHELLRLGVRNYITIRIIPIAYGAHAAMAGACRLMEFDDFEPVVYIEGQTTGLFLEHDAEIATYRRILSALADCALGEQDSRDMIAKLAIELYGEESHDRLAQE